MRVKPCLLFLPLVLIFSQELSAGDFYVSPTGSDSHPGTRDKPFLTLTRARDAVREVNKTMAQDITVHLYGGVYPIQETVEFGPQDSGHNGRKVIYSALSAHTAILTGGVPARDWQIHDSSKTIYRAPAPSMLFRQLYIHDRPAIRARTPNRVSETDLGPRWPSYVKEKPNVRIKKEHGQSVAAVPELKRNQVEMVMVCHWYHQRIRIGGVNDMGDEMEIAPVRAEGKFNKPLHFYQNNRTIKNPFYFENALEFVDAPNEWYHDPDNGYLYLALPDGMTPDALRVDIPVVETLIGIRGAADNPVRDLEFRGLTFQVSNWTSGSRQGVNMTQGAQVIAGDQPPGMLEIRHARKVALRNNVIRNAGAHGILFFDADSCDVEGNEFYHIAANGIDIDRGGGRNPPDDRQSSDVAIWNNRARKCGDHYSNGDFLLTANVKGLIVEHNVIHEMPYSGMQVGQQPGKMQDVGCAGNRIRFNHVHHCTQVHGDGGGIYTLGGIQNGSIIASNYVHDIHQSPWDHYKVDHIYLDNFTSKIVVQDNVVNGGRAAERNGSAGNVLVNNTQSNPQVENNAGIQPGYDPRNAQSQPSPPFSSTDNAID